MILRTQALLYQQRSFFATDTRPLPSACPRRESCSHQRAGLLILTLLHVSMNGLETGRKLQPLLSPWFRSRRGPLNFPENWRYGEDGVDCCEFHRGWLGCWLLENTATEREKSLAYHDLQMRKETPGTSTTAPGTAKMRVAACADAVARLLKALRDSDGGSALTGGSPPSLARRYSELQTKDRVKRPQPRRNGR